MSGKRSTNGVVKPISDNEQLSEVGNGKIPLPARWQFGVFGGPKKESLASRGVPNFGHTLFMAVLAYPFRKNGICTRTRGACRKIFARLWSKTAFELLFPLDLRYTSAEIEKTPQTLCICPCETFLSFPRVICRWHVLTCLKTAHFLVIFGDHAGHANFCACRLSDPGFYYFLLHDKEVIGEHIGASIGAIQGNRQRSNSLIGMSSTIGDT